MTDTTPNLALPELIAAQAQKHVTVNEALRTLDVLVQLAVLDRDLATPPGSPGEGERWLIAASPTGDWVGHARDIAAWQDGGWEFYAPQIGWLAYVVDEGALLAWTGTAWVDAITAITSLNNMTLLGVGTTADATNPFSAKLNNILWFAKALSDGGNGDLRWKMSKESAANTLSVLFQTAYSGRAELGLTADDDFHVKVSSDGSTWKEALAVDRTTGAVRFGGGITAPGGLLSYTLGIADDAATSLVMPYANSMSLVAFVNASSNVNRPNGTVLARCASTPSCVKLAFDPVATSVDTTTGALTGTTGTDGHVTISAHSDGKLYIENRRGSATAINVSVLNSIAT